ncbi:MAG: hypothetical protein DMG55_20950 [Acidobacteria bacterium]|nr:MAG: hypothetical protein DMG55_20950 [Acidobacteriota bacterium]
MVTKPVDKFEIEGRDIPQPGPGHVRIRHGPPRTAPRKLLFGSKRIQGWNPRGLRFTELTSIRTDDPEISPHQSERSLGTHGQRQG